LATSDRRASFSPPRGASANGTLLALALTREGAQEDCMPIRSVLWIGRADRFAGELVADSPTLDIVWETNLETALALPRNAFDAVVFDADDSDAALRGLARLRRVRDLPPVIARIDAGESTRTGVLLAGGAADVMLRAAPGGETNADLVEHIERLCSDAAPRMREPARRSSPSPGIIGDSPGMRELFALIERAGRSQATALVTGETGTGKELIARAIHDAGARRKRAFIAFNCAAFPETLLESELFGHVKGAFTGADTKNQGLFVAADRGTLFLDEVSETTGPFQAKLLRVLQEREVRPLGSARARAVDVRVIAASNRDLWGEVRHGRFREDLFYRLAVFPLHAPPLRERVGDIVGLAEFFLERHGRREHKTGVTLSPDAAHLLACYRWPGNVRELENEIQRALALTESNDTLLPGHFSQRVRDLAESIDAEARTGETLRESLQRIEALLLRRALEAHGGRRAATARSLGITREGLWRKMQRLGIS
jgi:transcriptional regulator with GAF, ATPase, and Fis domain